MDIIYKSRFEQDSPVFRIIVPLSPGQFSKIFHFQKVVKITIVNFNL